MRTYELMPIDGRKSFYNKAYVVISDDNTETLYSYGTKIVSRTADGELRRHYNGDWTATTGRHIKAFCGLNKKEWESMAIFGQ